MSLQAEHRAVPCCAVLSFLEHAQAVEYSAIFFFNCGPEFILFLVHRQHLPIDEFLITHFGDMVRMNGVAVSPIPGLSYQINQSMVR